MSNQREILINPIITEKTVNLQKESKYVFKVDSRATKAEIKKAVEDAFGVTVTRVNTVRVKGKTKRLGRFEGKTSSYKKAIVFLKPGERIKAFDIT
ncbi:MAG TPA: 50S ribosomal protein L23 [Candidatus Atribacteria bacterium]|jgi:large subunit ribosomal protein L23|uniref:50S ribosomal protein L23 n=1 Tax=Candidatus Sordicultor fermentans TaxID=1953203 RepID=UPI0016BB78F9|nr:50S ribosomal protein L23 [Atribacterota bacterium]NLY06174.1 50S ribosomal protein L23 [Candidatus Atribacteria bacterium]MDI9607804.1 50S ribosomal protein L23 [Atribacterota bacterium]MDY0134857.1 50S ribosomal protein L23 [Atribacterota bacterium]HOA98735.1 50S ribosomal protein L23 [Candidatus Atribacteria bacterium]